MDDKKQNDQIQLFEDQKIRTAWDAEQEEWYFSVVDVVGVLTDQPDTRHAAKYWSVLKTRLKKEGSELPTNCSQLKLKSADGKRYLTDVADTEQLLRSSSPFPLPRRSPSSCGWPKWAGSGSKRPSTRSRPSTVPWRPI